MHLFRVEAAQYHLYHGYEVPVRRDHAFAGSRGAWRVQQRRRVLLLHHRHHSTRFLPHHLLQCGGDFSPRRRNRARLGLHENDREGGWCPRDLGNERGGCEGDDGFGIGDLLGDFAGGVEGVGGGDDGAEGHDGEAHNGEVDGVGGEEEDDVALPDGGVEGERGGDGVHGSPELLVGEVEAGGGVDEGDVAVVSVGGDEGGHV